MEITNFYHGAINKLTTGGWLDHWTAFHIGGGVLICKIAQWLGATNFWAVMWVLILGIVWEIIEWVADGWQPYGTLQRWKNNTISDLIVETGIAIIVVL